MPELDRTKNYFQLNRGLNTESNEINFPDGYTTDEANYELLVDGSRRRRKGLASETGGANLTVPTITATQRMSTFKWRTVGGDPNENQIALQVGNRVYFMDDIDTPSTTWKSAYVDLTEIAAPSATDSQIANEPCNFSSSRGYLLISSRYIEPCYVEYDSAGDDYSVSPIEFKIRDFEGIDDGVATGLQPSGTITSSHLYNLVNRGWKQDDITNYKTNSSGATNPSKQMIWWKGYKRTYNGATASALINPVDGTHSWDTTKMEAERVGGADAPQGSIILNAFDTTEASTTTGDAKAIESFSGVSDVSTNMTITITGHGITHPASIKISGTLATYFNANDGNDYDWNYNGTYATTATTANTITFNILGPSGFDSWVSQYVKYGQIGTGTPITNPDGVTFVERPRCVEAHDGHIFYAGVPNSEYADTIFFSKLARKAQSFGLCFQEADPTDPDINQLTPTDGGTIVLPGLGSVLDMISTRNGLIIFSDQGIWEVNGGRVGVFTATSYGVRKISDLECTSATSPIKVEEGLFCTGPKGLIQLAVNKYTDRFEAVTISDPLVRTLWNDLTSAERDGAFLCYDDAKRRIHILYNQGTNANQYINDLILDLRVGGFLRYTFNSASASGILGAVALTDSDNASTNAKIKFFCQTASTTIATCDMNRTTFLDFDGAVMPTPYMFTSWDNLGEWQRRKQAPVITVYQKRTETGFTANGDDWDANNPSSTQMKALWDWTSSGTNEATTNKVGAATQVYRHLREFIPATADDLDGYPVVVTRNKVRGRGRALQLYFEADSSTSDSHILGYSINYKIGQRV